MSQKHKLINRFYRSNEWKRARSIKIACSGGLCEHCNDVGVEVHHVIELTPENVTDPSISIAQENLKLLCRDCHNKEHKRFKSKKSYFDEQGNIIS